jgi:GT2 family glycosyltransferase
MKLKIICVAYNRPTDMVVLLHSFLLQTCNDWELWFIHDGEPSDDVKRSSALYAQEPRIHFIATKKVGGNYGHPNRKWMLENIPQEEGDYVLITNDDNYYVPEFVEQMLSACIENTGFVMCDCLHSYDHYDYFSCETAECKIDMGEFIVRLDIAKEVGFIHDHHSADGAFAVECINLCVARGLGIRKIPRALFVHN